jgi:3-deoxy-D-manno-octulosonate 8-phosphate phosphatase (KDO 8-P phosphatase)
MAQVKLVILDIDGVMTDGRKIYDRHGTVVYKQFCDKDWTAIKRFRALGVSVMCITGDPFNQVILENRNLDVIVSRGKGFHSDKSVFLPDVCKKYNCNPEEIAFLGDDLFDIGIMKSVGRPYCVSNSPKMVKQFAKDLKVNGGQDAVMVLFDELENLGLIAQADAEHVMKRIYELDIKEFF